MIGQGAGVAVKAVAEHAPYSPFGPLNTTLISIMIGLIVALLRIQLANRKMTIQVNGEVRQEFIDEMAALRSEVKASREENEKLRESARTESEGLRGEVRTLREEVRKRDDKIDQLRDEVRSLHGVIDGMRREGLSSQLSAQRVIADALPTTPAMDRALRSLNDIQGDAKP